MEFKDKIGNFKMVEDGRIEVTTSEKYDNIYIENLQKTKAKLQETYEMGLNLLKSLKELKQPYYNQPLTRNEYNNFAKEVSKNIDERIETSIANYVRDICLEILEKGNVNGVSVKFGYKLPEILSLINEIERKLDKVMEINANILDEKY